MIGHDPAPGAPRAHLETVRRAVQDAHDAGRDLRAGRIDSDDYNRAQEQASAAVAAAEGAGVAPELLDAEISRIEGDAVVAPADRRGGRAAS